MEPSSASLNSPVCLRSPAWFAVIFHSALQQKELVRLYSKGLLRPVISRVYPLDEAPRALEDVGARRVVGKVVIDCSGSGREEGEHGGAMVSRL